MSKSSKVDTYQGKKVVVGIDVHQRTYSVVSSIDGLVTKKWTTVASPEKLEKLVVQLTALYPQASIYTAYEAGFSGFGLHRTLIGAGIEPIIADGLDMSST